MKILGIETSCDDTSVSVVENGKTVLLSLMASQEEIHARYNGVVPEIAARKHLEAIFPLINSVVEKGIPLNDIDAIGVTNRPGLIGSLLVGVSTAKALAYATKKPIVAIDHLAAHIYSVHLTKDIEYPYISLLVSGGHTLLCKVYSPLEYEVLGTTLDDAAGEAYDKVAAYLSLGYPGGPVVDRKASDGDSSALTYPISMLDEKNKYNFSFSGLKTAVVYQSEKCLNKDKEATTENVCASFQHAVIETLYRKVLLCIQDENIKRVSVGGGVAANSALRKRFEESSDFEAYFPERKYTTDNAAMVAGLAFHAINEGLEECPFDIGCFSRVVSKIKRG